MGEELTIVPITFRAAADFVAAHHRHHKPPTGAKFCLGVTDRDGCLVGVATVGRPVARAFDDGLTAKVNRTCTDGTPNANSALYGACWRTCTAMGYRRLVTYTQEGETAAECSALFGSAPRDRPVSSLQCNLKGWKGKANGSSGQLRRYVESRCCNRMAGRLACATRGRQLRRWRLRLTGSRHCANCGLVPTWRRRRPHPFRLCGGWAGSQVSNLRVGSSD